MEKEILKRLDDIDMKLSSQKFRGKKILTFAEACDYLGVSGSFLYKQTSAETIPHFKPSGKKVYFNKDVLNDWIQKSPSESKKSAEQEASDYLVRKNGLLCI